ncbi:acid-sensing ion channel 4-A-like [Anneissia japonica]|uniref:acid-sensing ion channel 4-A-like n=1 Tax=Anneissia japonica TaxID=1529436 RepID=UPI001425BABB|nr:acid-sensing ion channel 4-A-like [Anneissia japonica]
MYMSNPRVGAMEVNVSHCPDVLEMEPKPEKTEIDRDKGAADCSKPVYNLTDFLESTTMHGVKYTTRNHSTSRRLIWGFVILLLMSCVIISFVKLVIRFASGETSTIITQKEEYNLEFPAVTICNINMISSDKMNDSPVKDILFSDIFIGEKLSKTDVPMNTNLEDINLYAEIRKVSHDIKNMVNDCLWLSEYPCSYENFTEVMTNAGVCFTFNSALNSSGLRVGGSGSENGLWLRLNVEQEKYVPVRNYAAGFRVLLHSPNEIPDEMMERSFFISPGFMTRVSVNKQSFSRLAGYCPNDTVDNYTTQSCRATCRAIYTELMCGCSLYYSKGAKEPCSIETANRCIRESAESCVCSPPCNEEAFVSSSSSAYFPAEVLAGSISQSLNMSIDRIRMNFAELTIFYKSLRVEHSTMVLSYDIYSMFETKAAKDNGNQGPKSCDSIFE